MRPGQYFLARVSPTAYVVGLVLLKKARGMLAVFFGEVSSPETLSGRVGHYTQRDVLTYMVASTLAIDAGFWPLIDGPAFDETQWPLPWFGDAGQGSKVRYESNPFEPVKIVKCCEAEAKELPPTGVYGSSAASFRLESLLSLPWYPEKRDDPCMLGFTGTTGAETFLKALARERVSLSKPLEFWFYLYPEKLGRRTELEEHLRELGYEICGPDAIDQPFAVTVRRMMVPS